MRVPWSSVALCIAAITAGCGKRVPEPAPHPNAPHVSWEIKTGDRNNPAKTTVCQSDPRTRCALPRSTADNEVFATVEVYFHPATVETKYGGTAEVGLFEGDPQAHRLNLQATLKPGESPAVNTVYASVTSKPGQYHVLINAVATPVPNGPATNVRDDIVVVVQ